MKKNLSSYVGAVTFICSMFSCQSLRSDPVLEFIPGTYVRTIRNEFTTGKDSLVIRVLDQDGKTYLISHRSVYQQQVDGKLLPRANKSEKWTGTYEKEHHQLLVEPQGKSFTFLPKKGLLITNGGTEYKKVRSN